MSKEALLKQATEKTAEFQIYGIKISEQARIMFEDEFQVCEVYTLNNVKGKTISDILKNSPDATAVHTYKTIEGQIKIDNKLVPFTSEKYDISGITYIGGEVFVRDSELFKRFPEIDFNSDNLKGFLKLIRLDHGTFCPFREEDNQIPKPKQ